MARRWFAALVSFVDLLHPDVIFPQARRACVHSPGLEQPWVTSAHRHPSAVQPQRGCVRIRITPGHPPGRRSGVPAPPPAGLGSGVRLGLKKANGTTRRWTQPRWGCPLRRGGVGCGHPGLFQPWAELRKAVGLRRSSMGRFPGIPPRKTIFPTRKTIFRVRLAATRVRFGAIRVRLAAIRVRLVEIRVRFVATRIRLAAIRVRSVTSRVRVASTRLRFVTSRVGESSTRVRFVTFRVGKGATRVRFVASRAGETSTRVGKW